MQQKDFEKDFEKSFEKDLKGLKEVHLDFMDPVPRGHGMTTLADAVAKRPLLRSAVR